MKRGMSAVMVSAILVVIMLAAGAWFIYQQKGKTGTWIDTVWNLAFPSKTETIEIPGTTVGKGCGTRKIVDSGILAAAVHDCWKKATAGTNNPCCYKIDPSTLTATVSESELSTKLSGTGVSMDWRIESSIDKASTMFTVCYDAGWGGEVFLTRTPAADCS